MFNKIDVTYLPNYITDDIMSEVNLEELNEAYDYAKEHKARAFCTYRFLIPYLHDSECPIRLCSVIDFPHGTAPLECKLFEAGKAAEIGKRASSFELDICLHPETNLAISDVLQFDTAVAPYIPIKYIIELGVRGQESIKQILSLFDSDAVNKIPCVCRYIKTNTGRKDNLSVYQKKENLKWLRNNTDLPIKVASGVVLEDIEAYEKICGPKTIYGISYSRLKSKQL